MLRHNRGDPALLADLLYDGQVSAMHPGQNQEKQNAGIGLGVSFPVPFLPETLVFFVQVVEGRAVIAQEQRLDDVRGAVPGEIVGVKV